MSYGMTLQCDTCAHREEGFVAQTKESLRAMWKASRCWRCGAARLTVLNVYDEDEDDEDDE